MPEVRLIDAIELVHYLCGACHSHQNGECIDKMCWKYEDRARIENAPTIEADIDRAAILRLCNEIEMIIVTVCDTGYTLQDCDVVAIMKRTKAIRKELTEDAGTD